MNEPTLRVCAIVLSWNNLADTDECLRSLAAQTYQALDVLLVDNGSTDGSVERLEQLWAGKVSVLRNASNLGVAGGFNTGLARAVEAGADFALILNNDIVVDSEMVAALIRAFEAAPNVAAVSPIITYYHDPTRIWFAGGVYSALFGLSRHRYLAKKLHSASRAMGRLTPTSYIPSCAVMIRRPALQDVGLLDDRFFYGHDDIDWDLRAAARGLELRVLGRALVRHKVSVTGGVRGSNVMGATQAYHHARGSMLIAAKHARGWRLAPFMAGQLLVRLPYYCGQMITHRRIAGVRPYLSGLWDGYQAYIRRAAELPPG